MHQIYKQQSILTTYDQLPSFLLILQTLRPNTIYFTLLKLFKGAGNIFSIDDSATHPQSEGHLLSIDKDTEFPFNFPNFYKVSRLLTAQVLIQYLACFWKCADFLKKRKFGKTLQFFKIGEKHENLNQNPNDQNICKTECPAKWPV